MKKNDVHTIDAVKGALTPINTAALACFVAGKFTGICAAATILSLQLERGKVLLIAYALLVGTSIVLSLIDWFLISSRTKKEKPELSERELIKMANQYGLKITKA